MYFLFQFIRKLSNKQNFLKRLEEEDICDDIDLSIEAKERDINHNENISTENSASCNNKQRKVENKTTTTLHEDTTEDVKNKRKLSIHFEDVNPDKAVLQSLTSKLFLTADGYEFRRLQQLRSDTASEIVPYEGHFGKSSEERGSAETTATAESSFDENTKYEVVFEKVKYKEDVRYLRHTPSTCSLDNYIINDDVGDEDLMMNTMMNINNNAANSSNIHCLDNGKDIDDTTTRGLELHNNHFGTNTTHSNHDHDQDQDHEQIPHQHLPKSQSQTQQLNNMLPLNVSLGCIADGSYHQLFIGEERDYFYKLTPVVKWDINGNSLEDDDFPEFGIDANCSPAKSSLRSSSTTLETWLEVE